MILFIYFERESERMREWERARLCRGRGRGRDRETIASRLHAVGGTQCRDPSHDPGIMIWTKIKWAFNWLSHQGAPGFSFNVTASGKLTACFHIMLLFIFFSITIVTKFTNIYLMNIFPTVLQAPWGPFFTMYPTYNSFWHRVCAICWICVFVEWVNKWMNEYPRLSRFPFSDCYSEKFILFGVWVYEFLQKQKGNYHNSQDIEQFCLFPVPLTPCNPILPSTLTSGNYWEMLISHNPGLFFSFMPCVYFSCSWNISSTHIFYQRNEINLDCCLTWNLCSAWNHFSK